MTGAELATWSAENPAALAALVAGLVALVALWFARRALRRAARTTDPLAGHVQELARYMEQLALGQEHLRGGLQVVSDAQAAAQSQMMQGVDMRLTHLHQQMNDRLAENALRSTRALADMQERMQLSLHGSARQTTTSLTRLQERLSVIDKAQDNIARLSGEVLGLQDILSNKQTRGAFGEIQLRDILTKALPPDAFTWQATLGNGRRADCLVHLPQPPGPVAIDSKFPLEAYEALRIAGSEAEIQAARRAFRQSVRRHISDIAHKYIVEGETGDGAIMFLPSEAVYAELHGNFGDLVRESFAARVWIVSPTTCMATLNTMRAILKDARMREQAGAIRQALKLLHRDVELVQRRADKLNTHFAQARADLDGITSAAERAGKRAARLDNFDFAEEKSEPDRAGFAAAPD